MLTITECLCDHLLELPEAELSSRRASGTTHRTCGGKWRILLLVHVVLEESHYAVCVVWFGL